ncbi:hypothetical protein EZS27_017713 [termite gut metagenome]|uniref:Uncharacterized protein n=1 Tax=termite gut metagenome TaxID=433724 RepID=A0A5J4RK06_9ZZZZ
MKIKQNHIMKFFWIAILLIICLSAYSQTTKLSIQMDNVTVREVLKTIEAHGKFVSSISKCEN